VLNLRNLPPKVSAILEFIIKSFTHDRHGYINRENKVVLQSVPKSIIEDQM